MSTKTPIQLEPTICSVNIFTRFACIFQRTIEPLCETKKAVNTQWKQSSLERYHADVITELSERGGYSEALIFVPSDMQAWTDWLKLAEADMVTNSQLNHMDTHKELVKGELTIANHFGLTAWKLFSIGTSCSCCYGWRLIVMGVIGFTISRFV